MGAALAAPVEEQIANSGIAYREFNYQGVITYEYGSKLETLEVNHSVVNGVEHERVKTLSGKPFQKTRSGHHLNCIHVGDQLLRSGQLVGSVDGSAMFSFSPSQEIYQATLKGSSRVADRDVNVILVMPSDKLRNAYELSIDSETQIVLKRLVISPEGKPLERMQFATIEYQPHAELQNTPAAAEPASENAAHMTRSSIKSGDIVAIPEWMPPGFKQSYLSAFDAENLQMSSYSDGLSSFSIFFEPADAKTANLRVDGRARKGATVAYTLPVSIANRPFVLTVLGEIPMMTAARIARSVSIEQVVSS